MTSKEYKILIEWADTYSLSDDLFPRDKKRL